MSARNQVNIADEIKSKCNIIDVVGRAVQLKKAGSNYKGICPFHNEKTPSFIVSETKQIFTCFGCGATGDVLNFVERYYGLEFREAVEMLAREYGISLEGTFTGSESKKEFFEINRQAAKFFFSEMRRGSNAGYDYMKGRGISEEILNKYGIGYADENWTALYDHMTGLGYSEEKLLDVGLISKSKGSCYDKFRGRVMFPIINTTGKVIGFGGRIIGEGEPKYLNSSESGVFQKKNNLYGLNIARKAIGDEDAIILVEGYMDVLSLYQAGVRNVCASLGTALTENQARLIKRYTRNVILSYDADSAGQNAAFRGLDILYRAGCKAKVLKVTDGKDPDEFIRRNGKVEFDNLVRNAVAYGDFKLDAIKSKYDMRDEQERVEYIREAAGILANMTPVEADIYIKKLAKTTGVSENAIRFEYSGSNTSEGRIDPRQERFRPIDDQEERLPLVEQDLLKLMLTDMKYTMLPDDVKDSAFVTARGKRIYAAIKTLKREEGPVKSSELKDVLEEKDLEDVELLENNGLPDGGDDRIFKDCVSSLRKNALKVQETEILTRLSMADEEENQEDIVKLTQQLIEIQRKLKT